MGTADGARKGWTPERRETQRLRMLAKWADPAERAEQSDKIAETWYGAENKIPKRDEEYTGEYIVDKNGRRMRKSTGRPKVHWRIRFFEKVRKLPGENCCWIWIPDEHKTDAERNGPVFSANQDGKRAVCAYKWLYEQEVGRVPDGLELDHKCNNWRCVRPSHLEPVTRAENNRRYAHIRNGWTVRDESGKFAGRKGGDAR